MKLVRIQMDIVASFPDDAPEEHGLVLHSADHAKEMVDGAASALRKLGAAAEAAWSTP